MSVLYMLYIPELQNYKNYMNSIILGHNLPGFAC